MQQLPPLDTTRNKLNQVLAARGLTAEWLNENGDPFDGPNVARNAIVASEKVIPWRYRDAVSTLPELRQWADEVIQAARDEQRQHVIAAVKHGPSRLLLGPTGVGKTHQAFGAIRDTTVSGVHCRWLVTTSADLYAALRPRNGVDSETEFRKYRDAQLLLVDDLGAAKASEFTEDINFRLINHRYVEGLPTLFTSNVLPKELASRLGDRVASRLVEMCSPIVIEGTDRRRDAA